MVGLQKKRVGKAPSSSTSVITTRPIASTSASASADPSEETQPDEDSQELLNLPFTIPPAPESGRRKRVHPDLKLCLLQLISEKKSVLFGQFSTSLENQTKQQAWEEIRLKAMSLGICNASKDREWVRDKVWGTWKTRSLLKRDNSRNTGSAGGTQWQPSEVDTRIYDIIGTQSPAMNGLPIPESGRPNPALTLQDEPIDEVENESLPIRKKKKLSLSDSTNEKRLKQIELMNIEIYYKKLKCLKLERELNIQQSDHTKEIPMLEQVYADVEFNE